MIVNLSFSLSFCLDLELLGFDIDIDFKFNMMNMIKMIKTTFSGRSDSGDTDNGCSGE